MNYKLLLTISFVFILLCNACKKKEDTEETTTPPVPENALSQIATQLNLLDQAAVNYNQYQDSANNSLFSLIKMAQWLTQQPAVDKAYITDEYIITVHFKSGLKSSISVIPVNVNGQHLIRGGGSVNEKTAGKNSKTIALRNFGSIDRINGGSQEIGNDKVLIFIPYFNEFYYNNYTLLPKFSQGSTPLIPTLKTGKDADLTGVDFFSDYGFIIIDTHGSTSGFQILTKIDELDIPVPPGSAAYTDQSLQQLLAQANNLPIPKVMSGLLEIDMEILEKVNDTLPLRAYSVKVTDKYIRTIQHLNNAVVLGNYCYSGFTYEGATTSNMAEAFNSIGAVSYYGYAYGNGTSTSVANDFARQMEDSLITNLVINGDSTGTAHLSNDITEQEQPGSAKRTGGVKVPVDGMDNGFYTHYTTDHPLVMLPFYFKHYFDPRYGYGCGDSLVDIRDGEIYKTVCIGGVPWMAENLRYDTAGSLYANNDPSTLNRFGKLYTYDQISSGEGISQVTNGPSEIRGLCPAGWHIPNEWEYTQLLNYFPAGTPSTQKCIQLKSPEFWDPTFDHDIADPLRNTTEFSALPAGYAVLDTTIKYYSYSRFTAIWLSSYYTGTTIPTGMCLFGNNNLFLGNGDRYNSCRCVKD